MTTPAEQAAWFEAVDRFDAERMEALLVAGVRLVWNDGVTYAAEVLLERP